MKQFTSFLLCMLLLCGVLTGCSSPDDNLSKNNLMSEVEPQASSGTPVVFSAETGIAPTDFAVRLFQAVFKADENTMISPVSVLYALSMTANGAKGDTLAQMESVFGMTVPELNNYLSTYIDALPESEKNKLSIANSIWLTDDGRFSVEPDFLQTNANYYGADIYQVPFDDSALKNINAWVEENTDGMIQDILNEIPPEAVMYLINAITFDAEWKKIYQPNQVWSGIFTTENGNEQSIDFMHSDESLYLDDENAVGFMKHYADSEYAFVALLPRQGMSVHEYVETLTGEKLASLLANPQQTTVYAAIPKFESEYSVEMSEALSSMGIKDAFDGVSADFSDLGTSTEGNIFISRVLHKTFIAVDEKGTKAGAATLVEVEDGAAMMKEIKEVILDRPFVYMIIDCEANLPLFIGAMMDVESHL